MARRALGAGRGERQQVVAAHHQRGQARLLQRTRRGRMRMAEHELHLPLVQHGLAALLHVRQQLHRPDLGV
jgi:hypothetical protein